MLSVLRIVSRAHSGAVSRRSDDGTPPVADGADRGPAAFAVLRAAHEHEGYLQRRMHRPWRKRGS